MTVKESAEHKHYKHKDPLSIDRIQIRAASEHELLSPGKQALVTVTSISFRNSLDVSIYYSPTVDNPVFQKLEILDVLTINDFKKVATAVVWLEPGQRQILRAIQDSFGATAIFDGCGYTRSSEDVDDLIFTVEAESLP